jgi:hypothetical protein
MFQTPRVQRAVGADTGSYLVCIAGETAFVQGVE